MQITDEMIEAGAEATNAQFACGYFGDGREFHKLSEAHKRTLRILVRPALEAALAVAPAPADDAFEDALASFVAASRALDDIFRSSEAVTGAGPEVLDHWLKLSKHFYERSEAARRAVLDLHQRRIAEAKAEVLGELRAKLQKEIDWDMESYGASGKDWRGGVRLAINQIDALLNQKGGE